MKNQTHVLYFKISINLFKIHYGGKMKYLIFAILLFAVIEINAQPASRYIEINASSYLHDKEAYKYSPYNIFDGDPFTAWVEGVDGDGIGENITIDLGPGDKLWGSKELIVEISNGYQKSDKTYENNGIPTMVEVELLYGNKSIEKKQVSLPVEEVPEVESESGSKVSCTYGSTTFENLQNTTEHISIKVTLQKVKSGKKWKDSAISEIKTHFVGANPSNVAQFFKDLCVHYATNEKDTMDNTQSCIEFLSKERSFDKYRAEYNCQDFLKKFKPLFFVRSAYCVDAFYDNDCDGEDGFFQRFFLSGKGDWRHIGIVFYRSCNGC